MGNDAVDGLSRGLSTVLDGAVIGSLVRLTGGASRETWMFTADGESMVLQRQRGGAVREMGTEASVLRAAHGGGVPVPELVVDGSHDTTLGNPFMIVRAVRGETIARKIQRDDEFADARVRLTADMGRALAALHSVPVENAPGLEDDDQIRYYRRVLDDTGQPHPVFEVAFRWLEANRPESTGRTIVHGDFRLGNVMVDGQGLAAVLDWELAHMGDPMADLGWICINAWRFGVLENPVGGFGQLDDLIAGYEAAGGETVDRDLVRFWEVFGTLKWGISCKIMAWTHLSGTTRSVELAAIGRRACENELDLLDLLIRE